MGGCCGGRSPVGNSKCRWACAVLRDAIEFLWERNWKAAARKRGREGYGPKMGRIVIEGERGIKTQDI
jgi:hypothetical protein